MSYDREEGSRDVVRTDSHKPRGEQKEIYGKTGKWKVDHKGRALPEWAKKAGPPKPRASRASGGKAVADAIANTDMKEANQEREGVKHAGGLKRGGRATGGEVPTTRFSMGPAGESRATQAAGLKSGGRTAKSAGGDIGLGMLSPAALAIKSAVKGKAKGGEVSDKLARARARNKYVPGGTSQNMRDERDRRAADTRPQAKVDGLFQPSGPREERAKGGRTKGNTAINIIIGKPAATEGQPDAPGLPPPLSGGPGAAPMPMPVPVGPPSLGAMGAPTPGAPPPAGMPMGGPPPMMPPMARKAGGRTMTAGAESGLGRLQKAAIAKKDRLR